MTNRMREQTIAIEQFKQFWVDGTRQKNAK